MPEEKDKISIPNLVMQFNKWSDKQKFSLFMSLLDLNFWKETVDKELKKFEIFLKKHSKKLKIKKILK